MRMISFNERYVAGPESNQRPLDPQSDSLSTLGDSAAMYTWAAAWPLRPAKTQISLGIRSVWSESSLSAWRNIGSPRLIWVFAGRKGHFVDFVMRWLTFRKCILIFASGLRNKPHFWRPASLAQSTVSLTAEPRIASSSPSPATYW